MSLSLSPLALFLVILLLIGDTSTTLALALQSSSSPYSRPQTLSFGTKKVVIVGGGVGGLAIAARIKVGMADHGAAVDVTILERNERVGGRCGSFTVKVPESSCQLPARGDIHNSNESGDGNHLSFRHEHGPSLLLLPHIYEQLFTDCNTTAQACGLQWTQCVPAYQCIFEDGDCISIGFPDGDDSHRDKIQESRRKMDLWEPNGAKHWEDYMQACEAYLDCGLPNFIEERLDLGSFPAFLRESLRNLGKAWPLKPHSDILDAFFRSDKMKAIASFQDLYVGLEPFRNNDQVFGGIIGSTAPAVFGLLSAIELHPTNAKCGVFAPVGGFQAVTDAMEKLALDLGVHIHYNHTVTKISQDGVFYCDTNNPAAESLFMAADLMIANADLPYAAKCLVGDDKSNGIPRYDWVEKRQGRDLKFSSGVIAFHWSIDKSLDDLSTHNVFLAAANPDETRQSWEMIRDTQAVFSGDAPFNFYVHRASSSDASAAPKDCDSILVLVPSKILKRKSESEQLAREDAVNSYRGQFSDDLVRSVKDAVLRRMAVIDALSDLGRHIVDEVVNTPATYADRYNLAAGAPFGLSHGLGQLSVSRPGPAFLDLPNVIAVGASARPGNGVPLVLIGAKASSKLAIEHLSGQ